MNQKSEFQNWAALALQPAVMRRAAVVGAVLIVINHGHAIMAGTIDRGRLIRMALTTVVPYLVSTFSSVGAIRSMEAAHEDD